jgi:transcriptional regulator with XRE-family HTH domain
MVRTQRELCRALSDLRRQSGLTVRRLATLVHVAPATLGGYLSGSHFPRVQDRERIERILLACGVADPGELAMWAGAVDRAYGFSSWDPATLVDARAGAGQAAAEPALVTLRPPVERLHQEPRMRGRTALFETLTRAVGEQGSPRVHVLHGLGGVGKSFLALNLALWAMKRGMKTWWVSAGEAVSVTLAMRALAQMLGAPPRQVDLGSLCDVTWQLLDNHRRPWLLVVDNADDPPRDFSSPDDPIADAAGWLRPPGGTYGTVVVTTRDGSAATWGSSPSWIRLHRLRELETADAAQMLIEVVGQSAGTPAQAAEVATQLGGLPLALRLAGLHLREAQAVPTALAWPGLVGTFAQYARALRENRHSELLDIAENRRQRRLHLDQTWELSLEALEARGFGDARVLLGVLSCLSNAPIPYVLLLDPEVLAASRLFCADTTEWPRPTRRRLWVLLQAMAGLGLIDLLGGDAQDGAAPDTLGLHPVLRAVYRRHPDVLCAGDDHVSLIIALLKRAMGDAYPSDPASWPRWHALAPHCHSALDLLREWEIGAPDGLSHGDALEPAMSAAQYLRASERLAEAESVYGVLLDRATQAFGPTHPEVLTVRQARCRVWYTAGRWDQAEAALRSLLADRCDVLGPEHPDTLVTRHYLARVRLDQGAGQEAEERRGPAARPGVPRSAHRQRERELRRPPFRAARGRGRPSSPASQRPPMRGRSGAPASPRR